ncbi:hypothetical protein [Hydrogenimonas thermophila]|uniref:DUF541 domain-containing protein n=1 Tax=Hydrogenimonas thermophila TaxID=223786 RepID=A0A1I5LYK7_9BACT|nr:hypothetical protein [Hydrogenimonas thermophila]SFP02263.1 hypothetical protein SAMN05216234_10478 [Hydrogenimonas thermophila]
MKKIIAISLIVATSLFADLSTSTQKQEQKSQSLRQQQQRGETEQLQHNKQLSQGKEKSTSKNITQTLNKIRSTTHTVSKSSSGTWRIELNPIPYILMKMRDLGWNEKAFFLTNRDVGTSYYLDDDEEIIDLNAQSYYEAKAKMRGRLEKDVMKKVAYYIQLLNFTGQVAELAADKMQHYPKASFENIEKLAEEAVSKAYKEIRPKRINIYECRFAGNNDSYTCNNGQYSLILTGSVPTLLKNGMAYYSSTNIGFAKPTLTITFATNINDALSKLEQDQQTASIAKMIREYTSKLESQGKTEIAQKIKSKFIEKALTENVSNTASAVVNAINSASPVSVLNIFK